MDRASEAESAVMRIYPETFDPTLTKGLMKKAIIINEKSGSRKISQAI